MGKLFFETPGYVEGKYLVKRRDGTIPIWPHFVLAGADPITPWALRAYAVAAVVIFRDWTFAGSVWRFARHMAQWRRGAQGLVTSDPAAPPHRKDDQAVVAEMRTKQPGVYVTPEMVNTIGDLIGYARARAYDANPEDDRVAVIAEAMTLHHQLRQTVR